MNIGFFIIYLFNGIIYFMGAILFSLFPETMKNKINKLKNSDLRICGIFIELTGVILCSAVIFDLVVYFLIVFSIFKQPLSFLPLNVWIIFLIIGTTGIILLIGGIFFIFVPWRIRDRINKLSSFSLRLYGGVISFIIAAFFLLISKQSILQTFIKFLKETDKL